MHSYPNTIQVKYQPSITPQSQSWKLSGCNSVGWRIVGGVLLSASLFTLGCGNDQLPAQSGATASDVKQQTGEALDAGARLAQQEKNEFLKASRQEMDEMKAELDALKREANAARGPAKEKLDQQVHELEEKWNAADAKVAALRAESAEAWAEMKQQVLAALADLKESYQEVRREMTKG